MPALHFRAGNFRRIARGVFASVRKRAGAATWSVDRFLAASHLRHDSAIAYHPALALHDCAYAKGRNVQVIVRGEPDMSERIVGSRLSRRSRKRPDTRDDGLNVGHQAN